MVEENFADEIPITRTPIEISPDLTAKGVSVFEIHDPKRPVDQKGAVIKGGNFEVSIVPRNDTPRDNWFQAAVYDTTAQESNPECLATSVIQAEKSDDIYTIAAEMAVVANDKSVPPENILDKFDTFREELETLLKEEEPDQ